MSSIEKVVKEYLRYTMFRQMSRIQATQKFKLLVSVLPGRNFCIASQMDRLKSLGRQLFGVSWKSWEMDDGAGGGDVVCF